MISNDSRRQRKTSVFPKVAGRVFMRELYDFTARMSRFLMPARPLVGKFPAASGFCFLRASAKHGGMYSPTLDEFLKFATQGNLIPVTRRILADLETPLSAYRKIRGAGRIVSL